MNEPLLYPGALNLMRLVPERKPFVIDVAAANKPGKRIALHGYINGKRAPQKPRRPRRRKP